ncbi:MAG: cysteine--tRNA ligase [SAR202 cluster bacterium]|jgi:cysteinyl-tRNA synthetase|nr:cysteine--tRNA ligase [Chloroflexota bacterium]MDP6421208.1 cysteine--tRNA ligase [SAR202 cluster bacterium]HAL47447.1 cysteine--tRNA ligase [Dehalococcoidia bacterium]MDP6665324.1 cysteine--tRNA ligase [SAR202 cluster bacterium]MDP6799623.1 cysteine--tRNA ligase [SAR202 cluster bacterium]|tara:strand:- start:4298 stop:5662 length:1365 start_codon:yes stop_codon:yes gene_type:complete
MKLYNTLSGKLEEFTAPNGEVRMYVCGITPYAASHIGHAMSAVVFDIVRRYLEYRGFKVRHIQNFTDVDDKMINAAIELGVKVSDLAEPNIGDYLDEMDALNVERAHIYPQATAEIDAIIEIIEKLVDKGYAYAVDGDVYFRVRRDDDYGKLSHRDLDSMQAGARVEVDERKEDVMDFALWKSYKPGEPAWGSPWGEGRPGWHIECSAMSIKYLGETIDIHGGGQDLVFPHHENEIAQSESATDAMPFARFWLHNGMLRLGDDKMSKSLGNIISVSEALKMFSADAIRLFFMSSHYRSPLSYSDENVASQERALDRLRNALRPAQSPTVDGTFDPEPFQERFVAAMDDDLNTPRALAALFDMARGINRGKENGSDVAGAQTKLKELSGVLGLTLAEDESGGSSNAGPFIQMLVDLRSELRAAKQFDLADSIRDRLTEAGITLEDTTGGTEWQAG